MQELVAWISGLISDCTARAPHGLGWQLDRAQPPLTASLTPAECPTVTVTLSGDTLIERISFAARVQALLDLDWEVPQPACPHHGLALEAGRAGELVIWRCPHGDFECPVGGYREALWPPGPDEDRQRIAPMLAERFRKHGVNGVSGFSVVEDDGQWVANIRLRPGADEPAIRALADPILLNVSWVEAVHTVRRQLPGNGGEPARRELTVVGVAILAARLQGRLRRAESADGYDFLVGETPVRLHPDHRIGPPGSPLLLDADGVPFADEGDEVVCGGGFAPPGPVRGGIPVFGAGSISVHE
ncbi:MAG TPA: hypothetical protein VME01_11945 [Solirubrobacteraceae bacterium]|nr:hypothetical protein [Solirubrobacteraceae bacterium]